MRAVLVKPRYASALALALAVTTFSSAWGRQSAPTSPLLPNLADVSSVDNIVHALYAAVSGPQGRRQDWSRLRSLFTPGALMGSVWIPKPGEPHYEAVTVEQYIAQNSTDASQSGYFEKERRRHVDTFGNIAQVISSYESRSTPQEPKPEFRGINLMQLVNDGKRWWITSIQWQSEDEKLKLPHRW